MSFTKKIVMSVFFFVLAAILSGCGRDEGEQMRKKEIATHAAEKAKQFQEWQKSGKRGPPGIPPSSK